MNALDPRALERLWYSRAAGARLGRAALIPFGMLYGGVGALRNRLFDVGALRSEAPALPTLAVGNLSAGGTGKTPVTVEVARRLMARGCRPAVVLRGYGADEPLVHERLNPDVPVVVSPDRIAGIDRARERGATVALLDDAFQHRRARRHADVVLLSADVWRSGRQWPLPAGPWREPLSSLRRASLAVVTRKAAGDPAVDSVVRAVRAAAPRCPVSVARLSLGPLHDAVDGSVEPLERIAGARVLAIAAIGDPSAFLRQLAGAGALAEARVYGDHHHFSVAEVASLVRDAERAGYAVCTLKDAVKLAPLWPRAGPRLWYVSQAVTFEEGEALLDRVLDDLLATRVPDAPHT